MILFVCTGNTCRSVMAEALLRRYWRERGGGGELKTASAGLSAMAGDEASAHVRRLLEEEGIELRHHRARPLDAALVEEADLILVMTARQRDMLLALFPGAESKTRLLKEYAGIDADNPDVEDPFGGSREKYRHTLEEIRRSITNIIDKLKGGGAGAGGPG